MPSPTPVLTLIRDALALTNSVGADQTLTADETARCLRTFNDVQEAWTLEPLMLWDSANNSFTLIPNQATYTVGTGGNFNISRPVSIHQPMYTVLNGGTGLGVTDVSMPCTSMTQEQYNLILNKGQTQQYPERYLFVTEFPLAQITFWPIPSAANTIFVSDDRTLPAVATAASIITFPPGYAKAFLYQLALELPAVFGKQANQSVKDIAKETLATVRKANKRVAVAQFDAGLINNNYAPYQRGY